MSKSKLSLICLAILLALPSIALAQRGSKGVPPAVSSIAPTSATAGGPGFALTVSGSNFTTGSSVLWNGISISTTYVSATQLQGTIQSALIGAAGTAQVAVYTPGRSGGRSNLVAFTINPAPTTTTTTTTTTPPPPATPLAIATTSLPVGTAGTAYSQALAASGGTAPYTWSTTSGAVPPGLTLSSAGAVSGTPTTSGSYAFTAQVQDSASATSSLTYSVSIAAGATTPPLAVSTASVPGGTAGTAYSTNLAAAGGTSPYTWSVAAGSTLPPGLALSAAGAISGTPTTAATYAFSVQVRDTANNTSTKSYSLAVAAPTTTTVSGACINGTYGVCGDPYEGGGGAPATATKISACGSLSPTNGQYYLVTANIGSSASATCLTLDWGDYFTLDLGGHTVTGGISAYTNDLSGTIIFNGTVNCAINAGGVKDSCILLQSNQTPRAQARLHHLTVLNSALGASNIRVVWQPSAPGIANACKIDHVTTTVPSQPTSGRDYNILLDGGGFVGLEAAYNYVTCPSTASACQGIQAYDAPASAVHDNYIVLEQPSYDSFYYASARGILFDSQGKPPAGRSVAYNNIIYTNANRAIRVRAESGDVIRDNYFYNIQLGGRFAAVHIGECDLATEAAGAEVYNNWFELNSGNGVVSTGSPNVSAYVHDNTVTCYGGSCASAGFFALTDALISDVNGASMTVKSNNVSALTNAGKPAVRVCGPGLAAGLLCTIPTASTAANVCSSGTTVGLPTTCQ